MQVQQTSKLQGCRVLAIHSDSSGNVTSLQAVVGWDNGLRMTTETRIILRELAIIQTTLNNVIKQTDGLVRHSLKDAAPRRSRPYSPAQLGETISQMQKRLQQIGIIGKI